MIIYLHSKDATSISKLSAGVYNFSWNLNGVIHERFNKNTRLYIQDFNLCELYDNSTKNNINGSFQLRANFLNSKEIIDSNRQSIANNIIFAGNLNSYKNLVNTSPMYMYNYSINESTFNSGFLTLTLHLFDEEGSEFSTWRTTEYTLDESSPEFTTYNNELTKLNNNKQLLTDTKELINNFSSARSTALNAFTSVEKELLRSIEELRTALISRIGDATLPAFALTDGKSMDQVRAQHQTYIDIITDFENINTIIDFFNEANFTIGFPYYTGTNSGIRRKYTYVKNSSLPNFITTQLDASQLAQDVNNLSDATDYFVLHNDITDSFRTDLVKLPIKDVYFKSTSTYKAYNYFIDYDTNTKQATGIISLKIKNYFDNKFNITIEKIIPNSGVDDTLEDIPDSVLTFYIQGLDNLGATSSTTDLLSFRINKENVSKNSLLLINNSINNLSSTVSNLKTSVPLITNIKTISIDDVITSKLPNINMSMVLYNEQIETESIKGSETQNTISKSYLPQYKRI